MQLRSTIIFLALFATGCRGLLASTPELVWQLGTFDRSSAEFADGSPRQHVMFIMGRDEPDKNWYAYAPAVFGFSKPDAASEPRTIQFSVNGGVSGAYRLTVSLLVEHSSVPALRVTINDHVGPFYLHPKL